MIGDNIMREFNKNIDEKRKDINIDYVKDMILFEDENFLFLNKPAGIAIHGWNKIDGLTLNDYLSEYISHIQSDTKESESATFKPAFCFRLDKGTSWIIVAWKAYDGLKDLNELIREHKVTKRYMTVVQWRPMDQTIKLNLLRWFDKQFGKAKMVVNQKGDETISMIKTLYSKNDEYLWQISMVEVELLTWKMHQIRAHLSHIWNPVIWDLMYWNSALNRLSKKHFQVTRQLLHSVNYSFSYAKKKYDVKSPIPTIFKIAL